MPPVDRSLASDRDPEEKEKEGTGEEEFGHRLRINRFEARLYARDVRPCLHVKNEFARTKEHRILGALCSRWFGKCKASSVDLQGVRTQKKRDTVLTPSVYLEKLVEHG